MGLTLDDIRWNRRHERLVIRQCAQRGSWEKASRLTGIPLRFWKDGRTLHSLSRTANNAAFLTSCHNLVDGFEEHWEEGIGITVLGEPGNGKTTGVSLAAVEVAKQEFMVRWTTMPNLIRTMQRQIELSGKTRDNDDKANEWYRNDLLLEVYRDAAHLLVLDDVGKEYRTATGYAQDAFDQIIRHRYDQGLPTLITSNIPFDQWGAEYSAAMADFLHESSVVVAVAKGTLRKARDGRR